MSITVYDRQKKGMQRLGDFGMTFLVNISPTVWQYSDTLNLIMHITPNIKTLSIRKLELPQMAVSQMVDVALLTGFPSGPGGPRSPKSPGKP